MIEKMFESGQQYNAEIDCVDQDYVKSFFKTLSSHLDLAKPKTDIESINFNDSVTEFAEMNNLHVRTIKLENDWWKSDQGVLVILNDDNNPLILVPHLFYGYKVIDPVNNKTYKIQKIIGSLKDQAYMFYVNFPKSKVTLKQILMKCLRANKNNIIRVLIFHFLLGGLALISPIISGYIFDYIIPYADSFGLVQISFVLLFNTLFSSVINLNYYIAMTRVKLISNYMVQSAVWDRVVNLPLNFFMLINSGDVANRAASIDSIQQNMTSISIGAILTGFFSIFSLVAMIYMCPPLSFILFFIILILAVINIVVALFQYRKLKDVYTIEGKLYGYLNQLFQNISKIKVFNSQMPFFKNWQHPFFDSCNARNEVEKTQINVELMKFSVLILSTIVLYTYSYKLQAFNSFGDFFIYNSLFSYFISSFMGLASAVTKVISIAPFIERIRPILNTHPEDIAEGVILNNIKGKIELNNIYFRYENANRFDFKESSIIDSNAPDQYISPWILKNISLTIEENDFVSIVGLSGSGKTTLIKLILGLIKPQKGTISIDNYDMQVIDKFHFRKSIGTILQSSTLFSGSIIENIVGDKMYDQEKINKLAKLIGVDQFIYSLPMKYDTVLAENGRNVSMGQKQKILLMKALLGDPKLIIFDEATSALDNESQSKVFRYLRDLEATRIIISHRLSTIRETNKIFVIKEGMLINSGSFDEIAPTLSSK